MEQLEFKFPELDKIKPKQCYKCKRVFGPEWIGHDTGNYAGQVWYCTPKCYNGN